MTLPGYSADASLYLSWGWYQGHSGQTFDAPRVVAQQDCQSQCYSQYLQCLSGCGCPAGYTNCGGRCVDLRFDGSNCGACGQRCATPRYPGLFCFNGRCLCEYGRAQCCDIDDAGNCTQCLTPPRRCP